MCFGAIHCARIPRIVFATRIEYARAFGFNELALSNRRLKELAADTVAIVPDVLREASLDLFRRWAARPQSRAY